MPNNFRLILAVAFACLVATMACADGRSDRSPTTSPTATAAVGDGTSTPGALTAERTIELGREVAALVGSGDADSLWNRLDGAFQTEIGSKGDFAATLSTLEQSYGVQGARLSEEAERLDGVHLYQAMYRYGEMGGTITIFVAFRDNEQIEGLALDPAGPAATNYLDYETKTLLALPFSGEWFVFWGGRTQEQNYHVIAPDQRFAYDIVISREGKTHIGDGIRNEDYYCYGQALLSPAAGTVVEVIEGVDDNVPGELNPAQTTGNTIVIDHGNGEFSVMAHFKKGSIVVEDGDAVTKGQELGLCGNSGNSSEPHLHYHLQDGPVLFDAAGLPAFFNDYVADGEPVERGEPVRGQTISSP